MKTFVGSVPYVVDVNRLKEEFPVTKLTEGTIIAHDAIGPIVNAKKGSQRYYGVVNSWIAQMRNTNGIFMVWQPGDGVKVLAPGEILDCAETRTRQKIRQTGKAIRTFGWVDRKRLDENGQTRLDHQLRVAEAIKKSLDSARREMAIELSPVKSLPKPKLPTE